MAILKQGGSDVTVSTLCREHGMSSASYYKWRTKFGRLKELEPENERLKRMYSGALLDADILKGAMAKKW